MTNTEQFDHVFLGILQHLEKVEPFLDVVFSFLARRTDFFRLMHSKTDKMGFPPGVAEQIAMGIFRKYQKMVLGDEAPVAVSDFTKREKKKKVEVKKPAECDPVAAIGQGETCLQQSTENNSIAKREELRSFIPEVAREEEIKTSAESLSLKTESVADMSSSSEAVLEQTQQESKGHIPCKSSEAYNGAVFDNYYWSQSHSDIDVHVHLPKNTPVTKKDIGVEIKNTSVRVYLKNGLKNDEGNSVLLEGTLQRKVLCEESLWSLIPGENIHVNLEKAEERWWTALLHGEPEIDKSKIDSTKNIADFDEQTQSDFERVMYDHQQKQMGKPTSKEQETHELLKKAWDAKGSPFAGTPFDPSSVNISG